jgi:hypothetical protein
MRASLIVNFPPSDDQGAGNAGRSARSQPCVQSKNARKQVTAVTAETPGIPGAMVLTAYFVLPGDRALLPPSSAELTPPT